MGVETPSTDDVSARRREGHTTEPCERWAGQQNRRTDLGREVGIECAVGGIRGVDLDRMIASPGDLTSELLQ